MKYQEKGSRTKGDGVLVISACLYYIWLHTLLLISLLSHIVKRDWKMYAVGMRGERRTNRN